MLREIALFLVGVDHHDVGVVRDLLLADAARLRLRGIALGEVEVLHRGQRVGGVDQRDAPQVAQQPADLAGKPIVGMDHAIAQAMAAREGEDPAGESRELSGQLRLRDALVRPGDDVDHPQARRDLHDLALAGAGGAGEHVHLDAPRRQFAAGAQDVDVHAAGVAGARLLQRRGVHGDHRDTLGQDPGVRLVVAVHGSTMPVVKQGPQTPFTGRAPGISLRVHSPRPARVGAGPNSGTVEVNGGAVRCAAPAAAHHANGGTP